MVIIPTTSTDGHSQPVAIAGQEGQDPDEPPIPRPSSSIEEVKQEFSVAETDDIGTASNSVIDIKDQDGWNPFTGNADTAHLYDRQVVASFLGVNPRYVSVEGEFYLC
jgi:hypothetical protein